MAGAGRCRAEKRRIRLRAGARRNGVAHLAPSVERFENGDAIMQNDDFAIKREWVSTGQPRNASPSRGVFV
jgi:hypothetical protein